LLDLFESTGNPRWLEEAIILGEVLEADFADPEHGGWFMTAADGEALIAREKPQYDGAEPSGTSVALLNAQRLHTFTGDQRWHEVARRGFSSVWSLLSGQPLALSEGLLALDYFTDVPREIALVLPAGAGEAPAPLRDVLAGTFVPNRAVVIAPEGSVLAGKVPFFSGKVAQGGVATVYVCEQGRCDLPTTDAETLRGQLEKARPFTGV
jgi:uncharacterized protein